MILPTASSRRAFTLIELLIVIAIIAILAGLMMVAGGAAIDAAKRAQAKNDATQIAAAITHYSEEYSKMPPPADGGNDAADANTNDLWDALMPSATNPPDSNKKGMVFLEIPNAKNKRNGREASGGTQTGQYLDPWGNAYKIVIDGNYDNTVTGPDADIRKQVIVYSKGDPKRVKEGDTKHYVKSWE